MLFSRKCATVLDNKSAFPIHEVTVLNTEDGIQLILLAVLLGLSAFFSSAETAMMTASRLRIRTRKEEGVKNASLLLSVLDQSPKMLSAILIGNNLVNISASSLAATLTMRLFGSRAVGITTGLLTLLVLIFGEITPKTIAAADAERLALVYARPVYFLMKFMTPAIWLVDLLSGLVLRLFHADLSGRDKVLTKRELRTIVDAGREDGAIKKHEHQVITNVFDFSGSLVREVMVPRVDMVTIDENDSYETVKEVFRRDKFTRLPVYRNDRDNIVGIINIKDFLFCSDDGSFHVSSIMYEPYFTYEFKKISHLLREMRQQSVSLTIVLDEYGQPTGMVTLEDLLEELVGEIRDEYDEDEKNLIRRIGPGDYLIEGSVKLDDINDELGLSLDSDDYDSIGGYIIEHLDDLPQPGEEVVTADGICLKVQKMDINRIDLVRLRLPAHFLREQEANIP